MLLFLDINAEGNCLNPSLSIFSFFFLLLAVFIARFRRSSSMNHRFHLRLIRLGFVLSITSLLCLWFIPSVILPSKSNSLDGRENDDDIEDNHIYPPPWYLANWTMNDYFQRKDRFKNLEDQHAINQKQKIFLQSDSPNQKKSNYLILEYTHVFSQPKFCDKTHDFIFGKQCPYQNCR